MKEQIEQLITKLNKEITDCDEEIKHPINDYKEHAYKFWKGKKSRYFFMYCKTFRDECWKMI